MNYAMIENEKIVNVIVSDKDFAAEIGAVCCEGLPIGIGDGFRNGKFEKTVINYDEEGQPIGEHIEYYDVPSDDPVPSAEELQQRYDKLSIQYIHKQYSYDDENKIIREYISDNANVDCAAAFEQYNAYVLECKSRAHIEVYGQEVEK